MSLCDTTAILDRTPESAAKNLYMQDFFYTRSIEYSNAVAQALLMHPSLDTNVTFPAGQQVKSVYYHKREKRENNAINQIGKKYALYYFYNSQDPYAQAQVESLQRFADEHHLILFGVSMDGKFIKGFDHNIVNSDQAEKFGVQAYPALFISNPKETRFYPIQYGFFSLKQLSERFYNVATKWGKVKLNDEK